MKIRLFVLIGLIAVLAFAGDVTGKWQTEFTTPDGQTRTNTLMLKADGEKLTGTLSSRMGDAPIQDGKVSGDDISFTVVRKFQDNEFKMNYKGKVEGDTIKFTVEAGERTMEVVAKRVKES